MSYKSNNPNPPAWTYEQIFLKKKPEPYDHQGAPVISEIETNDGTGVFLMKTTGEFFEGNGWPEFFEYYAIEAPRNSEMRRAFEWGEISWKDYWTHKGWLLRIKIPFNPAPVHSDYVSIDELSPKFIANLEDLAFQGPYQIKLEVLELACVPSPFKSKDLSKQERIYQQFLMRHGHKLLKNIA
jgi:hypothetical protein